LLKSGIAWGYAWHMSRRAVPLLAASSLAAACLVLALGCATTAGAPYRQTVEEERRQEERIQQRAPKPQPLEPVEQALEIDSTPDGASVYLNSRYVGDTPLLLENLAAGRYQLRLELSGFYPHDAWIDYTGGHMMFSTDLRRVTGFLQLDVQPPGAGIRVGDRELASGSLTEMPTGVFAARVRLFGYEEYTAQVRIEANTLTRLEVRLQPAAFRLEDLRASRVRFNPANPGALGRTRVRFRVSAPGFGSAAVLDPGGAEVWRQQLESFTTWEQAFDWTGRSMDGAPLPDGSYILLVEARPESGGESLSARLVLQLNHSLRLSYRALWNGSSGLLFVPSPEVLPRDALQASTLLVSLAESSGGGYSFPTPWELGMRYGIGSGLELDARAGVILGYGGQVPWFAGAAVKLPLSRGRLETAALARLNYQGVLTDPFAGFTGLSLGLPLSTSAGPVRFFLAPELTLSLWEVTGASTVWPDPSFTAWAYLKAGAALALGPWSLGLSAAARTLPFTAGFGLDLPLETGLELHWMIPGTQAFLSAAFIAEFGGEGSVDFGAGGGLGLLN
jgi:hypothetical protein